MNLYLKRVRWYVVGAAIVVIATFGLVVVGWHWDTYFTFNRVVRSLRAVKFEYDYAQRARLIEPALASVGIGTTAVDYSKSIPVVVYHGIPYSDVPTEYSITLEKFKDQIFALKEAGYTSITVEDLYHYLKGEAPTPKKAILITFDDGRVDSFELADPVLEAVDYRATMFAIGRYSLLGERQKYYLSARQLKEMEQSGRWGIEAHSYDGHNSYPTSADQLNGHFFSHKQWLSDKKRLETDLEFGQRIKTDLEEVKSGLEKLLGRPVLSFAYPYGDFGQNNTNFDGAEKVNMQLVQNYYQMAFYQVDPVQRYSGNYFLPDRSNDRFFMVKRITVDSGWSGKDLLAALNKAAAKNLPYADAFTQDLGWRAFWGKLTIGGGQMLIRAEPDQTGGTVILDGSRLWQDYSAKATVVSPHQSNVYMWARFKDDDNNAACSFGNGFIHVEQTVGGQTRVIQGQISQDFKLPVGDFTIETRVKGRDIQCVLNDRYIVESQFLDPSLTEGGIGFKTWEPTLSAASLTVKNLVVAGI